MKTVKKDKDVNVNAFVAQIEVDDIVSTLYGHSSDKTTYQCLPADGLNEPVYDFCNQFGTDSGTAKCGRIPIHACLPISALLCHCR